MGLALIAGGSYAQNAVSFNNTGLPIVGVPSLGGTDCAGGEIYDDGGAENGYSGNPALISSFQGTQVFTPSSYPFAYDTVCVGLVSLGGPTLDFNIEVLDDDGTAGGPGTSLGSVPVSVATLPAGLPCGWFSVDISSLNLNIASGNVWIGVQWNPMSFPSRFICADESAATPLHPGQVNFNNPSLWQTTQTVFPAYRAKLIRALGGPVSADLSIQKTGIENPPGTVVYTINVTNNGPADATNVVVTDTLPAELAYVSDDCGGTNTPPWTWNVGNLTNGASAACNITMSVVTPGAVNNTATVAGDQPDPTPANDSSTATLTVTGEPEEPILAIPTLQGAGLAALLTLLAAVALVTLRRRRA
jgi:uncharacterized repeat protein (TIGR01451 family)